MSSSRFISCIIGTAMLGVVAAWSVNYIVDPFGVFGTRFFPEYGFPQERYMKIEYLKNHPDYNTFLIGGSRPGVIKTEVVDRYFPGAKTYNLSLLDGIPSEFEKYTEWLVKNMPDLSHVFLQIDWPVGYRHDPKNAQLNEFHPDISGRSRNGFLLDFLSKINFRALGEAVSNNTGGLNQFEYDFTKGYWRRPLRDKQIDTNCGVYKASEELFPDGNKSRKKLDTALLTETLAAIARIKTLLDKKKVKLTVFLSPFNNHQLDAIEVNDYELFVTQLVKITDFYNFMYYNKITMNDCNYYEASHFRPYIGDLVVRSLAEQRDRQSDIYHYVSKESVNSELEYIKANFFS
ncbi:MAG: hypothetical protein ACU88J_10940, partial [Gammaproteobacteria bacterium]